MTCVCSVFFLPPLSKLEIAPADPEETCALPDETQKITQKITHAFCARETQRRPKLKETLRIRLGPVPISTDNLLARAQASMKSQHPAPTPCVAGFVFTKADCPLVAQPRPACMPEFRGLIALANYFSVWTRPDITFVVNKLCKYMANPADSHVDVFERLLRYLIGTRDLGLVYSFNGVAPPVVAYSDSSHLGCVDSSRSTLAYCFSSTAKSSHGSKLHTRVTTCSNHSEYVDLQLACTPSRFLGCSRCPYSHL